MATTKKKDMKLKAFLSPLFGKPSHYKDLTAEDICSTLKDARKAKTPRCVRLPHVILASQQISYRI